MSASDVLMNMSWPTERELEQHTESQNKSSVFVGVAMISFFIYIIILIITFVVKKRTKTAGVTILILEIITMAATNLWGDNSICVVIARWYRCNSVQIAKEIIPRK